MAATLQRKCSGGINFVIISEEDKRATTNVQNGLVFSFFI